MWMGSWTRASAREGSNVPFAIVDFRVVLDSHTKGAMYATFFDQFVKAFVLA